jgi:16S rRNA (cytosine967-C5)-methyltransferase
MSPRELALKILNRIEKRDSYLNIVLNNILNKEKALSSLDRAFITDLVYGVTRHRLRIDWIIGEFSNIKKIDTDIMNALRLGIYQLLFLDRVPPSAAINEAVKLVKQHAKAFVNAVLRNIDRNREYIRYPDNSISNISILYSHPEWMVKRWYSRYGPEETRRICELNNRVPQITIRANKLKINRDDLIEILRKEGMREVSPAKFSKDGIYIRGSGSIERFKSFRDGLFQVQDEASQLISYILSPNLGDRVLDICSAPGGKTTHIAELMGNEGEIYSIDINRNRQLFLKRSCLRLGIDIVKIIIEDVLSYLDSIKNIKFSKILIDPPCSGLGVLSRNPDIKWRRKEEDIYLLSELQLNIINNVSRFLEKDGIMVYSVCTLEKEENEDIIKKFLEDNKDFILIEVPKWLNLFNNNGFFNTLPFIDIMDGFFAACLKRI